MNKNKFSINRFSTVVLPSFILIFFLLLLLLPDVSFEYMKNSLKLCVRGLIPSLFPFMVISDFLISGNYGGILKMTVGKIISLVFGTSADGSFSVLLGFLCGFPIGAKSAIKLYSENKISYREFCHIMSFCNIPSPAFLCGSVGLMFNSRAFGVLLLLCVIISSCIMGIIGRAVYRYDKKSSPVSAGESKVCTAFTEAVTSSASVMLCVCGYVVFFSVIIGYASALCDRLNLPRYFSVILSGIFEISNGMSSASGAGLGIFSLVLAGFFAGFSGLSVIFQIISLDSKDYIPKKVFILQKLLMGLICAAVTFIALKIFPVQISPSAPTLEKITFESYGLYVCILFFISAVLPILASKTQKHL